VAKTIWYILKKKDHTGELRKTKRLRRQLWWMVKKNPVTTVGQIKNTLKDVGVSVSKSTTREDFTRINTGSLPQDVKHWLSSNRMARLEMKMFFFGKACTVLENPMDR
jgi:hypothetical protein